MNKQRVHQCPVCERACACEKGWEVLDNNKNLELTDLKPEQCDCEHIDNPELTGIGAD